VDTYPKAGLGTEYMALFRNGKKNWRSSAGERFRAKCSIRCAVTTEASGERIFSIRVVGVSRNVGETVLEKGRNSGEHFP